MRGGAVSSDGYLVTSALPAAGQHLVGGGSIGEDRFGSSLNCSDRMFGELNEKQEEYSKDIHAPGQHLLSLINDILDLSKIEAGRMELELTEFHLPTALDSALTLVRERAGRRSIDLQMSVDERLGEVRADERKIRQVVPCRTRSSSRRRAAGSRSRRCQRAGS